MSVSQGEPAVASVTIDALLERAGKYLPAERLDIIRDAFEFAARHHEGQFRKTGDPYITHPVAVAELVANLELDHLAIAAALLHDVQEDCGVRNEEIAERFGPRVAKLVDALTKLDKLPMNVAELDPMRGTTQAQNLRKMFLAMAEDLSVVLIKLCDRLHNMRTLWAFPPEKQRRIALETQEIFAPLASRLGVWQIKWELEDLAFRYLEPEKYREIAELLASKRVTRERVIAEASAILKEHLEAAGITAEVTGRAKHIYSIYQKMRRYSAQSKSFDQIYDLLAMRVFVDTVSECYHALGVIHALWRPIPGQFDDYIGNPKDSMYQSLHTTVVGPGGRPLEIQIRTWEMHRVAEYGVAAHWRYKEGGRQAGRDEERIAWLRQLIEWQRDLAGADEFVESVKTDIFHDQVFVYTPKGDVLDLPAGATPLDFAYRIHTDLGHQTVGAKVNGRMVPLNSPLKTGDVVEILRSRTSKGPSRDWLNQNLGYIRTAHSREKIRQWFRKQERAENIERGREMLEKELKRLGWDVSERQEQLLSLFNYTSWEDFLAAIGYGGISTNSIARKVAAVIEREEAEAEAPPELPQKQEPAKLGGPGMRVLGVGNLLTTMARCCNPVPGDQIIGYVTRSRGVSVHRADCLNVLNEAERERIVEVEWGTVTRTYPVSVRIEAWDRVGLLRDITTVVTDEKVNMVGVRTIENGDGSVTITTTLETTGIEQLSRLLSRIEIVRGVRSVERVQERRRKPLPDGQTVPLRRTAP
ncbi:MAG: (p)ppGpp synthetase [Tepidiforma sp.]|uniref:Bifunctional (P)ppGpp synthetase/guanosine-3',5'-bis(Diphosphate) 3'-pyrophosphohydrolase n=1 Tax=Tepidiforma bonchosmolovskayae TaxID=2601677 RepID=A0ABX6BZ64_9CHLR|nr:MULTISPECIES: bifunctional (p)ppGpp synthetase/guanosine-3',5'-bis(diphosphate) 3'-pyrophosphohydrolase [Tepidiforma]QFG01794.1 bifunctional (p)ppGpp synthetase/guanosine-3',5'-bis(diphosphate) 3'-pyrophosphohydrolase [Tepidiforma bonchosmolovskayae]GIW15604.1 MAG: (p)ppGpp synthetase [Tepidiforma sp.]